MGSHVGWKMHTMYEDGRPFWAGTINKACNFSNLSCEQWHKQLEDNENHPHKQVHYSARRMGWCIYDHWSYRQIWGISWKVLAVEQSKPEHNGRRQVRISLTEVSFALSSLCLQLYWVQNAAALSQAIYLHTCVVLEDKPQNQIQITSRHLMWCAGRVVKCRGIFTYLPFFTKRKTAISTDSHNISAIFL